MDDETNQQTFYTWTFNTFNMNTTDASEDAEYDPTIHHIRTGYFSQSEELYENKMDAVRGLCKEFSDWYLNKTYGYAQDVTHLTKVVMRNLVSGDPWEAAMAYMEHDESQAFTVLVCDHQMILKK